MKTFAILLSGGTGERVGINMPKQYIKIAGKPIICYSLLEFDKNIKIDGIIVVAKKEWHEFIQKWVNENHLKKEIIYANAGENRQESVYNGLKEAEKYLQSEDVVLIHDAARPNITDDIISDVLDLKEYDGVMPAIPVKDTIYMADNNHIIDTLNRDILYAGQSPESYRFGPYLRINKEASKEVLAKTRGSSEIAVKNGMNIKIVMGNSSNYKITTKNDLKRFEEEMEK